MAQGTYDIITVGGGLGGSTLAKVMVERGARVLVLERERQFRNRVRGEVMVSWGVAEAQALGIDHLLRGTCGHELPWLALSVGPEPGAPRDLLATTPQQAPSLSFAYPVMQDVLLQAAADAGGDVRRGAHVRHVQPGTLPRVEVEQDGYVEEVRARLVVGADGRASMVRTWADFSVRHDPERLQISGVLFEEMPTPREATGYYLINPGLGQSVPTWSTPKR
jgi:flavin-dependent dehydrogenase